jgi:hypothetical protein
MCATGIKGLKTPFSPTASGGFKKTARALQA